MDEVSEGVNSAGGGQEFRTEDIPSGWLASVVGEGSVIGVHIQKLMLRGFSHKLFTDLVKVDGPALSRYEKNVEIKNNTSGLRLSITLDLLKTL